MTLIIDVSSVRPKLLFSMKMINETYFSVIFSCLIVLFTSVNIQAQTNPAGTTLYSTFSLDSRYYSSLVNNGTIISSGDGMFTNAGDISQVLINNGTITSSSHGMETDGGSSASMTNNGTITASGPSNGIGAGSPTPTTVVNTGSITNNGAVTVAVYNAVSINNSGTITGHDSSYSALVIGGSSIVLTNSGTINSAGYGITAWSGGSTISTLTNTGTITGSYGINYSGTIRTLNNSQGAGNTAGALTYKGTLPTNYNIIINSPTNYGSLSVSSPSGALNFGIYSGSNLSTGVFTDVLSGLTSDNIASGLSGSFTGGYLYSLSSESSNPTNWDLTITRPTATVSGGGTTSISSVSSAGSITVSGSTLQASNTTPVVSSTVHLSGSSPTTIDSSGLSTTFSSTITSTDPGKLVIADTSAGGKVTLNATGNSIVGGVAVTGGTLAVGDASNTSASLTADVAVSNAATLIGHGTINGAVTNNGGVVRPGGSIGTLSVSGNYTQTSSSTLAIEINPTQNSVLAVSGSPGTANLNGGLQIIADSGTYSAKKYTILTTTGGLSGTFTSLLSNLSNYSGLASYVSYDANDVYFTILPFSLADTQQSLANTSNALQGTFTLQNSVLTNSFSYDCNIFGENDICISAGGRNTNVQAANGLNNNSALLIAAYRVMPNIRVGGYADQNLSVSNPGGTVSLGNNTPLMGAFAAWNARTDGLGTEVKISAAYGQKNTTVTRPIVGTSEPGSGSSQLNSQGAQITAKYGFNLDESLTAFPYVGMRYTQNNMNGYTENTSPSVTVPLTYSALNTNATTALAGIGMSYQFIPKVTFTGSMGIESDTNTSNGTYIATGVPGLTPINFNPNPVRTRPSAMLGAYYDIETNQRLGITGIYRQEPYQSVSTTSAFLTYTIGI